MSHTHNLVCTSGAWEGSTVEDALGPAHLEDILLADTHQAGTPPTPEGAPRVEAPQGTAAGALAAAPDPFLGADLAPHCHPQGEEDPPAQMDHLPGIGACMYLGVPVMNCVTIWLSVLDARLSQHSIAMLASHSLTS